MKCLVKDRARRYQQASEIQRDLEAFMRAAYPTDAQELSSYITQLFASEGASGEKRQAPSAAPPPPPAPAAPAPHPPHPPHSAHATPPPPGRVGATVPLPQAGQKASVLVPAQQRKVTGDREVPVPSDAAPTAHASPEEVARAQQLAAVRSGIMAALPHRKSMRHELGKRKGTVTMRGNEQRRVPSSDRHESVDESMGKSTPSRAAMGALAPPPMSGQVASRESQSFTSPEAAPMNGPPSEPGDQKMTEAIPAPQAVRRRRTPQQLSISADTEANTSEGTADSDDEEGGPTASILPGQLAALAPRRPAPPPPARNKSPLLVIGISFTVVLLLGIILLFVLRGRAPAAPPPPAPAPSGDVAAPGTAGQLLAAVAEPSKAGEDTVCVRFEAPAGTVVAQGDKSFQLGTNLQVPRGQFAYEYRCPRSGATIATTVLLAEETDEPRVIRIRCGLGR